MEAGFPGSRSCAARGRKARTWPSGRWRACARRIAAFDDPAQGYLSWAAPQFINQYPGDYDHLARLWEWHVIGEGESEGGGE